MTKRIGILGGGQLGRMLALAAFPLGARVAFLDPAPDAPLSYLARQICGAYDDGRALDELAAGTDVVTYEFENVPVASADRIAQRTPIFPPPAALGVSQDRWAEKCFFRRVGVPTPPFACVDSPADLEAAIDTLGLPVLLKTRRLGYDGKGQILLRAREDAAHACRALGTPGLIAEAFVPFDRELSLLAVRGQEGACAFYPLVENRHREGILRVSLAPASNPDAALQAQAEEYARKVLKALDYVGVLAIEWFQVGKQLLANEMAPRVHNSGHWSIEGATTSQFENHVRAVLGLPLGSTTVSAFCAMVNFIGTLPEVEALFRMPGVHVHMYDKAPRPGRKLGHVTIVAEAEALRRERLAQVLEIVDCESHPLVSHAARLANE